MVHLAKILGALSPDPLVSTPPEFADDAQLALSVYVVHSVATRLDRPELYGNILGFC